MIVEGIRTSKSKSNLKTIAFYVHESVPSAESAKN